MSFMILEYRDVGKGRWPRKLSKAAASRKKLKIGLPIQSVEIVLAAPGPPENPGPFSCYQQSKATSFQLKMCTSTMRRRRQEQWCLDREALHFEFVQVCLWP